MIVRVRLHAVLRDLLPGGKGEVEVQDGATITELLDKLKVDPELRELVTVNGEQAQELSAPLKDGDEIEVFPAVAGGGRNPYLEEGIRLFNEGEYFLCHETLEEHWIEAPEAERDFYQGLIHLAVGFHHYERGNERGARSQFFKARRRLADYPDNYLGIDLSELRSYLDETLQLIERGEAIEPPRLN